MKSIENLPGKINLAVLGNIPKPRRVMAPFLWYGGKGKLAKWIIEYLPREGIKTYVEPFAGAASVFWHLPEPYPVEALNDVDGRIINLFRVLQDREKFVELAHRLIWTPYSRAEFRRALEILKTPEGQTDVDLAWAFFTTQNQGFGGVATSEGTWGRALTVTNRGMAMTTNTWRSRIRQLVFWHNRLTRVQLDNIDGIDAIEYWDTPETLFYVDPPYLPHTRVRGGQQVYHFEFSVKDQERLVDVLLEVKGHVLLSGYDDGKSYTSLEEAGWRKLIKSTVSYAASRARGNVTRGREGLKNNASRVECLWLSPSVVRKMR